MRTLRFYWNLAKMFAFDFAPNVMGFARDILVWTFTGVPNEVRSQSDDSLS